VKGDRHGQRHLQWLAYGRCLARQVARIKDGKINDAEAAKACGGSAADDYVSGWRDRTCAKAWRGASGRPSRYVLVEHDEIVEHRILGIVCTSRNCAGTEPMQNRRLI
jgi:hypothetical protein